MFRKGLLYLLIKHLKLFYSVFIKNYSIIKQVEIYYVNLFMLKQCKNLRFKKVFNLFGLMIFIYFTSLKAHGKA